MAKKVLDLNSVDVVWRNASEKFLRKDEIITSAEAYAAEEPAADVAYEKGELMFTFALPRGLQGIPGDPGKDGIGKDGDGVEYVYLLTNDNEVPGLYVPENFYEDNDYRQDEYLPYISEEALEQGDVTKRWTDNYVAPTATMRYSWVAIRKSKDGIWQPFSTPKLWNIYKTAGKSFVDIYKRSDTLLDGSNLPQHSNPIYYKFSNDTFYSDLEATSELKSICTGYNTWYHDIPSTQGRYLYRASAYVDIIDLDHPVEINENAWMGPYFMSSNGEAIKTGYVIFDDDSFSLPIKENGHPWMDYNYSFNAYLWYGQDKLNINEIEVKDNSNGIEFNSNVIGDVATVSFAISKDYIFNDLSYINVTLSGEYEGEPITGSLQFKVIPFISEDGKFYKLLLSKDTILTPNEQTSEEDMNKWNDSVSIQVVDAKGNVIDPDSINCKLYYTDDNGNDREIVNGLLNFKSGESSQYNSYIDILEVPNPMVIKLVDDNNQTREIEYVNFIGTPLNGVDGADGISARTVFAFTSTDGSEPATPQGGSVDFDTNEIIYPSPEENDGVIWGDSNNLSGIVWMSQRDFYADGTKDTAWTTPIRITGEQGEPGTDGSSIEFIYRLCQSDLDIDDIITAFDQYKNQDKSQIIGNDNWTDSPSGISIDNRIELCSTRSKSESTENTDGKWSEWCTPFIWSKWGEDGIDGDGVEYIFFISDKMNDELGYNKPPHPGTTLAMKREELSDDQKAIFDKYVNSFDFFPGQAWINKQTPSETEKVVLDMLDLGWTDDPQDVGPYEPVEFVSIRKKKVNPETNSITYEYTDPRVWSEWKRPGYDTYTEFIFAVHENLSSAIIEGGNYGNLDISGLKTTINGEKVEVAWFDTLPQNNDPSKFIWMAKGFVSSELIYSYDADGKIDPSKTPYYQEIDWSSPIKMIDSQYMQVDYTSALHPGTPASLEDIKELYKDSDKFDITTLEGLELAFRDHEMEVNGVEWSDSPEDPIWMIVSTCNNGVWSDWSLSRIKGEPGLPGVAGATGAMIYPAGEWKSDVTYINDGNSAPYVLYNEDYFILKTEGEYINEIPTNSVYWMQMAEFEAIYAKVGVIDHGLIGSAVFYGDWMFSQYGYDSVGNQLQDENSYKKFGYDVSGKIMTELNIDTLYGTNSAFKPMTALNFKDGSGAFAGGQISWDLNGNLILPPTGSLSTYYKTDFTNETQTLYCSLSISSGNAYGREVDAHLKLYKLDKIDGFDPNTDSYYKTLALGGSTGNGKIKPPYSTTLILGVNDGEESDIPTHVALFVNGIVLAIGLVREEEEYITVYWDLSNYYENTSFKALVYNYYTDLFKMNDDTNQEEPVDYKYIKYITDSVGSTNFKWREIDEFDYCIISSESYGHKSKGVWYVNGEMIYNNHESVPGEYGVDGNPYPYNEDGLICSNNGYYYYDTDNNKVEVSSLAESRVYNPSYSSINTFSISSLESPRAVSIERKYWRDSIGNTIKFKNNTNLYAYFEFGSSQHDVITDGSQTNGADYSVINEYGNIDDLYTNQALILEPKQTLIITRNSNSINYESEDLYITLGNKPIGNGKGNVNSDPDSSSWIADQEYFSLSYDDETLNLQMNNTGYIKGSNGGQQNVSSGGNNLSRPGYITLEDLYAIGKIINIGY